MVSYGQIELILLCFYCLSITTNVKWNNREELYEMCKVFASSMHFKKYSLLKFIFFQCLFITKKNHGTFRNPKCDECGRFQSAL